MHQPAQEGAGRDHERPARVGVAVLHGESHDPSVLGQDASRLADDPREVRFGLQRTPDPGAVDFLVRLGPRRPHRRPPASIEKLELNRGFVDGATHQAAQGIDLAHEVPLRRSANRRVARHVGHRLARQRADSHARAQAPGGMGGLDAGVAGADDDDVEIVDHRRSVMASPPAFTSRCRSARKCARSRRPASGVRSPARRPRALPAGPRGRTPPRARRRHPPPRNGRATAHPVPVRSA